MPAINFPAWVERVVVDEPAPAALAKELDRRACRRVFVLMSGTLSRSAGFTDELTSVLGPRLVGVYAALPQHSPLPAVIQAARTVKESGAEAIASIGGGSVIDAAKIVQYCLMHGLFDEDSVRGRRSAAARAGTPPIHICVPTTISGAEFTYFAGMRDPATGLKDAFVDPALMPGTLIFDPQLTLRTPQRLWLSSGVRALDHAIEGLCSDRLHPFAATLALQGISELAQSLRQTKAEPQDLQARRRSQFGAWFASIPLLSGVTMGASHAIGHALGSLLDVPHGLTSCVILPAVMRFNYEAAAARFEPIARALGGERGEEAPELVRSLIAELGLPTSLAELGLDSGAFPRIVAGVLQESWLKTNPQPVGAAEVLRILEVAS